MHSSTILALIGASSLAAATPLLQSRAVTKFPPGLVWDIVLDNHYVDLEDLQKAEGTVIDIDLLDPIDSGDTTLIPELAKTKLVICYFSAGSREDWRADAGEFEANDYGQPLDPQWTGERWTNVKSDNVKTIMKSRIEKAAEAGCHAVDPDNVDGYVS
jgi:endo-alpha-1,4-polygalactosaminidase (GH114 family)